jgi:ClpP class serine protease
MGGMSGPTDSSESESLATLRIVLFQTGLRNDRLGAIDHEVFQAVQDILDANLKDDPSKTAIDVWLDSPGGSASSAYKIFLELSTRCKRLRFVIPDYAKSAATLRAQVV